MLLLTVVSLAPAILLMTTSFVRIIVVLGLLRQALGTQQLPPSQVITSIALFMTLLLMAPVWNEVVRRRHQAVHEQRDRPRTRRSSAASTPVRRFMAHQIQRTENDDDVYLFLRYMPERDRSGTGEPPNYVYYDAGRRRDAKCRSWRCCRRSCSAS